MAEIGTMFEIRSMTKIGSMSEIWSATQIEKMTEIGSMTEFVEIASTRISRQEFGDGFTDTASTELGTAQPQLVIVIIVLVVQCTADPTNYWYYCTCTTEYNKYCLMVDRYSTAMGGGEALYL